MARLFLTDYASYNNGTQFEFGHWVDLTDFADANDFCEYIDNHFAEADEKSPLPCGSSREEVMFTDYEGFPSDLYGESMGGSDMEHLFAFLSLSDDDKAKAAFLLYDGQDIEYALDNYDDVYLREYDGTNREKYFLFEEYYPDAEEMSNRNDYVTIDYDRFIDDLFIEFEYDGVNYLVQRD
jgi:antirestriction protein